MNYKVTPAIAPANEEGIRLSLMSFSTTSVSGIVVAVEVAATVGGGSRAKGFGTGVALIGRDSKPVSMSEDDGKVCNGIGRNHRSPA
jgi:hypothetical protein